MNQTSLSNAFYQLFRRDLLLAFRHRAEAANPPLFFVLVITLFALGLGAESQLLKSMAPGVIWVAALLAAVLSLDSIFRSDFEDGSLEQFLITEHPLAILVLSKVAAHWLITGVPLLLVAPLLGVLLGLPSGAMATLMITLALGTPVLSLIGAIAVALTVGLRRGGVILSLLVLPLYVPVLIFATSAVETSTAGIPVVGQLSMLAAFLAGAITLAPPAVAAALRVSMN
ncbi:MAG TPA: heme exporter protein CcmB [Acidiferrobacteraceae bacterium]|nr:heme exporter protein CcmB [Acidiferrobacteraceae bacterium]